SSFGPMTTSATTPITRSSLQPISNMVFVSAAKHAAQWPAAAAASAHLFLGLAPYGGRGLVIDGLRLAPGLSGRGVVVSHALLEGFDALGHVAHHFRNLAASEQKQHNQDDNDPVPDTQTTHDFPPLRQNLGPGGGKNKNFKISPVRTGNTTKK